MIVHKIMLLFLKEMLMKLCNSFSKLWLILDYANHAIFWNKSFYILSMIIKKKLHATMISSNAFISLTRIQCFPGKRGLLANISPRIHPTDQISIALLYPLEFSMISGALYHLVATYSVKKPVWSCSGSATRAKPKSQI